VIEREASGTSTVTFPQEERPPAPAPPELVSSATPEEPTLARAASPAPSPSPAQPLPPTRTNGTETPRRPPGVDYDEIYAQVVERLRRELLREREQIGDLLGDVTL
jgi:hypothetical protein